MAFAWVLIVLPLTGGGGGQMEVPYDFSNKESCAKIAQWLYPEREFRCVERPIQSQIAGLDTWLNVRLE